MVLSYDGVYLWKACVEKAGSFDVDAVRKAWKSGVSFDGPGGKVTTRKPGEGKGKPAAAKDAT